MIKKMTYIILALIITLILASLATVPNSIDDISLHGVLRKDNPEDNPKFNPLRTPIARIYAKELANPLVSGASLIENGVEAFLARVVFARMATKTIDMQTYIYSNDPTSRFLLQELRQAADRGVKVRILVDDNGMDSDMSDIMLLDVHENINVKVFNTFKYRSKLLRYPQFLFDFKRLNSRMHNKQFIVDGAAVIIGGRNVSGNDFAASQSVNFSDTDVVFLGKIAREAQQSFNDYWKYHLSIPAYLFPGRSKKSFDKLTAEFDRMTAANAKEAKMYNKFMSAMEWFYKQKMTPFYWGKGSLFYDHPSKVEHNRDEMNSPSSPIVKVLGHLWKNAKKKVLVSAAYFVPGKFATEGLVELNKRGIDLTILTNSLSSSDASAVYASWEKYRTKLLKEGIKIYEFMNISEQKIKRRKISSSTSLHSKTIVFDDKISWIGSFNLDLRSVSLNTEIVAVFENEEFAKKVSELIEENIKTSWKLSYEKGKTVWRGTYPGSKREVVYRKSPNTSLFKRVLTFMMKLIPEWLT